MVNEVGLRQTLHGCAQRTWIRGVREDFLMYSTYGYTADETVLIYYIRSSWEKYSQLGEKCTPPSLYLTNKELSEYP